MATAAPPAIREPLLVPSARDPPPADGGASGGAEAPRQAKQLERAIFVAARGRRRGPCVSRAARRQRRALGLRRGRRAKTWKRAASTPPLMTSMSLDSGGGRCAGDPPLAVRQLRPLQKERHRVRRRVSGGDSSRRAARGGCSSPCRRRPESRRPCSARSRQSVDERPNGLQRQLAPSLRRPCKRPSGRTAATVIAVNVLPWHDTARLFRKTASVLCSSGVERSSAERTDDAGATAAGTVSRNARRRASALQKVNDPGSPMPGREAQRRPLNLSAACSCPRLPTVADKSWQTDHGGAQRDRRARPSLSVSFGIGAAIEQHLCAASGVEWRQFEE